MTESRLGAVVVAYAPADELPAYPVSCSPDRCQLNSDDHVFVAIVPAHSGTYRHIRRCHRRTRGIKDLIVAELGGALCVAVSAVACSPW